MKIYNKKNFARGIYFLFLAVSLLGLGILRGFQTKNTILMVICAIIGGAFLLRSLSRELSREDKLDALDERNRLIAWKSQSKSHKITQLGSGILLVLFLGLGIPSGNDLIMGVGLGATFCFTISLLAEFFTQIYYERKN